MTRLLPLLLALSACVGPPSGVRALTAHEAGVVAQAAPACDAETVRHTRLLLAETREQMVDATGYCEPVEARGTCDYDSERVTSGECPWGCASAATRDYQETWWPWSWIGAPRWPLIVIWRAALTDGLLTHEAAHLDDECAGREPDHHRPTEQP